tara:strand:+ start:364 stop:696 length:333 start_codon:yes stop_codon:yes gene_type:complete
MRGSSIWLTCAFSLLTLNSLYQKKNSDTEKESQEFYCLACKKNFKVRKRYIIQNDRWDPEFEKTMFSYVDEIKILFFLYLSIVAEAVGEPREVEEAPTTNGKIERRSITS